MIPQISETTTKSIIVMDKNIIGIDCEYYGTDDLFYVYSKTGDWFIDFSPTLSSTNYTWKKGCSVSLHINIVKLGHNWKYELDSEGFKERRILTQERFLTLVRKYFLI